MAEFAHAPLRDAVPTARPVSDRAGTPAPGAPVGVPRSRSSSRAGTRPDRSPGVLAALPVGYRALVVDNGSDDGTAAVALALRGGGRGLNPSRATAPRCNGASSRRPRRVRLRPRRRRVAGPGRTARPGGAAAVRAPTWPSGRRVPEPGAGWPLHARLGNAVLAARLRRRFGLRVHDIGAVRAARVPDAARPRGRGPPVRLSARARWSRAARAGLRVEEFAGLATGRGRPAGPRCPGSVVGSAHGHLGLPEGDPVIGAGAARCLVVAKAPVAGLAQDPPGRGPRPRGGGRIRRRRTARHARHGALPGRDVCTSSP